MIYFITTPLPKIKGAPSSYSQSVPVLKGPVPSEPAIIGVTF